MERGESWRGFGGSGQTGKRLVRGRVESGDDHPNRVRRASAQRAPNQRVGRRPRIAPNGDRRDFLHVERAKTGRGEDDPIVGLKVHRLNRGVWRRSTAVSQDGWSRVRRDRGPFDGATNQKPARRANADDVETRPDNCRDEDWTA